MRASHGLLWTAAAANLLIFTLCHDSLTEAERKWLRVNRPPEAAHWNLLTDMKAENLPHGRA